MNYDTRVSKVVKRYETVRDSCVKHGMTCLRASIYATLDLEDHLYTVPIGFQFPYFLVIEAVALPDIRRYAPIDDQEAHDKEVMLADDRAQERGLLMEAWRRVKQNIKLVH